MFWMFKRRAAMTDFWVVFNNHAQVGDPAGLVGWVEASTKREALKKAHVLTPQLSFFVSRVSRCHVAEIEAAAGRPVDFQRLVTT